MLTMNASTAAVASGALGTNEAFKKVIAGKMSLLSNMVVLPLPEHMFSTIGSMWFRIFVWTLSSWLMFHVAAGLIAFVALRRHRKARWLPLGILVGGLGSAVSVGGLLSGLVGLCYHNSGQQMPDMLAMLAGFAQTLLLVLLAFSRVLTTL